jgi:histidinol dehydrogenase
LRQSIDHAIARVERFQKELRPSSFQTQEEAGLYWGIEVRPLSRVGIYVPKAYFLTMILNAVPARLAGVDELIVATPPDKKFGAPYVDPALLYAAKVFEIDRILLAGGVGGLAALALGSEDSLPVEKIVGATSKLGVVAKQKLSADVGIDGYPGPTEVAFVCDSSSSVKSVAADIVGLSDHNPNAEVFVFHHAEKWLQSLIDEIIVLIQNLKSHESREAVRNCLESNTHLFLMKKLEDSLATVNRLSPGLLCLVLDQAAEHLEKVKSCGSLLLGHYTSPVCLDLIGGATGLVSTLGSSAHFSLITPQTFCRLFSVVEIQKEALQRFQKESLELSEIEGFMAHQEVFGSRLPR